MMIVTIILTIMMTIGLPTYDGFAARNRLKSVAESLSSDFHYARSESILRGVGSEVSVVFSTDGGTDWCYGMTTEASCDCGVSDPADPDACTLEQSGEDVLRVFDSEEFRDTVLLSGVTFPDDTAKFTAVRGLGEPGQVSLVADGQQVNVSLSATGQVRICSDSPLGYLSC